ncbi:MAG TPA: DUF4349 domain-containing protein, partial [Solirubrobacterales bacterium]|nr:DUF4349 domain-containing protein [Solirubrobacterales bacterium]
METPRDDRLAEDLRALRPAPRPEFTAELDERAAAGFPRRSRLPRPSLPFDLRSLRPRQLMLASGAMALLAIVVVSALVTMGEDESETTPASQFALAEPKPQKAEAGAGQGREDASRAAAPEVERSGGSSGIQYGSEIPTVSSEASGAAAEEGRVYGTSIQADAPRSSPRPRAVERSAQLVLGADPGDVGEDSSKVFEAVHAHDGIVMSSSTREGKAGAAGARFELLIPSAKLSDALAALSAIDEVVSRHEATTDITAPTITTAELLRDSKARI